MKKDFILFGKPVISNDEIKEVADSLKKGWLGTGPKVNNFEKKFSLFSSLSLYL